jgi:RNA polymerase sigma factor (sigma-70 family)
MGALQMTNDLRLELRFRNNVLWHAIFDHHKSVAEFCDVHKLQQSSVGDYLNLKHSPYNKKTGELTKLALQLCVITQIPSDDLFPPTLYNGSVPSLMIAEVDSIQYVPLSAAAQLSLPASQDQYNLTQAIDVTLYQLSLREEQIIRLHYGLDGQGEHTYKEIAKIIGLSTGRIAQIESKAFRKLRHRSRSRFLKNSGDFPHIPSNEICKKCDLPATRVLLTLNMGFAFLCNEHYRLLQRSAGLRGLEP